MALRVLLADESTTIKKVIQLALQDFAVEVKAVPIGVDVISVAKNFKPDIIFADVLLAKRSGYDVCSDVKADSELRTTPVVLMWSGFMEIDETKLKACKPDGKLEKPFDAETLRSLVRNLVQSTKSNKISEFLSFAERPDFDEPAGIEATTSTSAPSEPEATMIIENIASAPADEPLQMNSELTDPIVEFSADEEEPDDFEMAPLPSNPQASPAASTPAYKKESLPPIETFDSESWANEPLDKFRINLSDDNSLQLNESVLNFDDAEIAMSSGSDLEEIHLSDIGDTQPTSIRRPSQNQYSKPKQTAARMININKDQLQSMIDPAVAEEILRESVREVLQNIAWQILPDITERVVREEIQKLIKDSERL